MAYSSGVRARISSPSGGQALPILGSGRLSEGVWKVEVTAVKWWRDTVELTFVTEDGDVHKERWWVASKYRGYTREWKNWLAQIVPDLEAIQLYKSTGDIEAFVGTKLYITIGLSEGYTLVRDGNSFLAKAGDTLLTSWGTFEEIVKAMEEAGIPRSYNEIVALDASEFTKENVANYVHNINKTKMASKISE